MKKKIGLVSLGCAKNRVDSEVLLGKLVELGCEIVQDPAKADYLFVNTCGFIEPAKEESIEAIFEMAQYKKDAPGKRLFVTGCLAQRYAAALAEEIPEIDGIMGVSEYARVEEMIEAAESGLRPCFVGDGPRFLPGKRVLTTLSNSAYVKISDGCDNRCSYCAIPLIRGGYRSRPMADILEECRDLAARGVTELTLVAQDTSRYGTDFPQHKRLLPELLRQVSAIDGVKWVRALYCYPDTTDDALLDALANTPKVAPYLDLPLQHIDDDMLKAMNRRGTSDWIRSRIAECRKRGLIVRTTFIVGFPGETDAQFETLANFVKETRFDRMGAFPYSPEEGTRAAEMPGQIDEEIKQKRLDQLMLLQQGISQEINEARVGTEWDVLCEGFEDGMYFGRSILEAPESDGAIRFSAKEPVKTGTYVRVKLTGADAYDLYGEVVQ